jgi:protein-L-isoaspartate(D-aspartate) O-methyltransferase
MTANTPDPVDLAIKAVDEDTFTRTEDGTLIAQSSSQTVIASMIRALGVTPGNSVLEIGTGSGYSTALLAHLTGPTGNVVSLDVVPVLTERAGKLLHTTGYRHTRTLTGDGALGAAKYAPYDRIIAWTTPEIIPAAWITQATDHARLVTPVNVAGLSKTYAVITAQIDDGRLAPDDRVLRGSFVEMSALIRTDWLVPPHGVDVQCRNDDGKPWWLSARWLNDQATHAAGGALLGKLAAEGTRSESPLAETDDPIDFYAWLLANRPAGLTTACLGDPQWRIGHTDEDSAAFIPLAGRTPLVTVGSQNSARTLAPGPSTGGMPERSAGASYARMPKRLRQETG